ncbi:MAG: hypothetical protein HY941_13830 [Gammaproteobacteria bacterium]|nr:hypothetical protein [Gammaproteobacteria bacterium]
MNARTVLRPGLLNVCLLNVCLLGTCLPAVLHAAPATTLIDPTQPSGTPQTDANGGAGGWRLSATRITPAKRLAVINGTQVAEGDLIGAARVLRVSHAQVKLVKLDAQGEVVTLRLLQAEVKKTR